MQKYSLITENYFPEIMEGKEVLVIPVYSMRNYETGLYDIECDGNWHIAMNVLSRLSDETKISLTIPINSLLKGPEAFRQYTKELACELTLIGCNAYGKNANETRLNKEGWAEFLGQLDLEHFDFVLFSPQLCFPTLEKEGVHALYWMYHSRTEDYNPEYLHPVNAWDRFIAEHITTVVASANQFEYFGASLFDNAWYNVGYMNRVYETYLYGAIQSFKVPTIFIPFRQNHDGYHIAKIFSALYELEDTLGIRYQLLYSAPNGVVHERLPAYAKRISSDKVTYLLTLRAQPLIPLLESVDDLLHYSMYEFVHMGAKLMTLPNAHIKADEPLFNLQNINHLPAQLELIHTKWQNL